MPKACAKVPIISGFAAEESDTAIAKWNQEHPEAELLAGLAIVEVNGRRKGEVGKSYGECHDRHGT